MTSSQPGISTAYEAISQYRLYLDLMSGDTEFNTGFRSQWNEQTITSPSIDLKLDTRNILSVLYHDLRFSNMYKFIIDHSFQKLISDSDITLFVPVQDITKLECIVDFPRKILNNHIVDSVVTPVELIDRRVRVQTANMSTIFINNMNIQDDSSLYDNHILESINCANGFIYVIENPIDMLIL